MTRIGVCVAAAAAALSLSGPALCQTMSDPMAAQQQQPVIVGDLQITAAWARTMLPGQAAGAAYLTVTNTGTAPDRLVGAASPAAAVTEIHRMEVVNDVMTMRPVEGGLEVPAGAAVELKPGGLHVMLMDVATPFATGTTVPLTLEFERAGKVELQLPVQAGAGHSSP